MAPKSQTKLMILSGPSGAGKSTVVKRVLEKSRFPISLSVSATTRTPRPGEENGVHYHFLTKEDFLARKERGEFLECFEVFGRGDWYGTLRETVTTGLSAGKWIILEIDVHGAKMVLQHYPDAVTVFLHPGSLEELERRLRKRGTETEASIARRLEVARAELDSSNWYQHIVINHTPEQATEEILRILESHSE